MARHSPAGPDPRPGHGGSSSARSRSPPWVTWASRMPPRPSDHPSRPRPWRQLQKMAHRHRLRRDQPDHHPGCTLATRRLPPWALDDRERAALGPGRDLRRGRLPGPLGTGPRAMASLRNPNIAAALRHNVSPPRAAEQVARLAVIPPATGCRAASRLANETVVTRGEPHPTCERGASPTGASRIVLTGVPLACHKQRSPAVSSGQSRSLQEGR
jgi:hypothetical protein